MVKVLGVKVCHFVTWLRFAKIGFIWGFWPIRRGFEWGESWFVWGSFDVVDGGRGVTSHPLPVLRLTGVE